MNDCDFTRLITMYETGGLDNAMNSHLQNCPDCQTRLHNYFALTSAMIFDDTGRDEEDYSSLPDVSLPDRLNELICERKKQWQKRQLGHVLQFGNIRNKETQKSIIKRLMEEQPFDLPKAAFPDDLEDEDDS